MSDVLELYLGGLRTFGRHVASVSGDQWYAQTPADEWDVRELVNHVLVEQLWVPPLIEGLTTDEVGDRFDGDQLGDDPLAAWRAAAAQAHAAVTMDGALDGTAALSYGDTPTRDYLREMATDLLVHGWDLATAVGIRDTLDPDAVDAALDALDPDQLAASGLFGDPVDVPDDADAHTRLLAAYGRRA